jgi:hypothetical protein
MVFATWPSAGLFFFYKTDCDYLSIFNSELTYIGALVDRYRCCFCPVTERQMRHCGLHFTWSEFVESEVVEVREAAV